MSRIAPAAPEVYEPLFGADAPLSMQIYARAGAVAEHLGGFLGAVYTGGRLPPRLVELVRIRIAWHNQCRSCMATRYGFGTEAGVDEELVCALEHPPEAGALDDAERAAIAYADLMARDHLAIDDAAYDRLREHFDEALIVELGVLCGMCIGLGRLAATWDMVEDLPERFREPGVVTPWGGTEVVHA